MKIFCTFSDSVQHMSIFHYVVLTPLPYPKNLYVCFRIIRVAKPPQFPPFMKSSMGPVLLDSYFRNPYPSSPGGGLFGQINKHQPFELKGLSKCHSITVNPLTIRIPQSDIIQHLHSSFCGNILYQPMTSLKILAMVLPLSIKPPPTVFLVGLEGKTRHRPPLLTAMINPFRNCGPYTGFLAFLACVGNY